MSLRILYVAYPMLPVTASVPGGAEQMLWTLEREMASRGHRTSVAACAGSQVSGRLIATGLAPEELDAFERRKAEHEGAVLAEIRRAQRAGKPYDLVHDNSGCFWTRATEANVPILATLHLPPSFYPHRAFDGVPANAYFNCVSEAQLRSFGDLPHMLGMVKNGIRMEGFSVPSGKRDNYLLWVGRICEEKGPHVAIDVARAAGLPLVIAGDVYRFTYHQDYFEREILPHLYGRESLVHHVEAPELQAKVILLQRALALLVTSSVDETSSLVAMEAMACGTPVVAFRRGALREIVDHSVTGFLVNSKEEMVSVAGSVATIDPQACRARVANNFTSSRMADEYEQMYARVIESVVPKRIAAA